jgi:hypothetical protein
MSRWLMTAALVMFAAVEPASAAFAPNRTVTAVDEVAKTLSCSASPSEPGTTYKTTSTTRIRVEGKSPRLYYLWEKGNFSQIKVGDVVTVQYHVAGSNSIADRIVINPKK